MKKILFGTSAIAASLFTMNAYAGEWSVEVGGFHTVGMGVTNVEASRAGAVTTTGAFTGTGNALATRNLARAIGVTQDVSAGAIPNEADVTALITPLANTRFGSSLAGTVNGSGETQFHLINDGEIHFDAKLVADSGLTFGVNIEMETAGGEGTIDESSLYVSGSFGKIEIGEQDGAYMAQGPKGCTAFTCAGDGSGLLFDRVGGVGGGWDANGGNTGDDLKISYFTPTFSGFQAGVSYIPNMAIGNDANSYVSVNPRAAGADSAIEVGAKYAQDFGGFGFSAGAGYTRTDGLVGTNTEDNSWGAGAAVSASGFTFGGSVGSDFNGEVSWSVGANYATGPWNFGVNYFNGSPSANVDSMGVSAGADYTLAQGVKAGVAIEYATADGVSSTFTTAGANVNGNATTVTTTALTDQEGWAAGTFLNVSF